MRHTLIILLSLLFAQNAFAAAGQKTESHKDLSKLNMRSAQLIKCEDGITALSGTAAQGEECEAGDWTLTLDCRGTNTLTVKYTEEGTSSTAKVWSCVDTIGATAPGSTHAAGTCVELTAAVGVTMSGTTATSQGFSVVGDYGYISGEIDLCTACQSELVVSCTVPFK